MIDSEKYIRPSMKMESSALSYIVVYLSIHSHILPITFETYNL